MTTKSKCNNDLHHNRNNSVYPVNSCFTHSFEYLNDELLLLSVLQFFPEVARNSLSFPCSKKSQSIPGFPLLWQPWLNRTLCQLLRQRHQNITVNNYINQVAEKSNNELMYLCKISLASNCLTPGGDLRSQTSYQHPQSTLPLHPVNSLFYRTTWVSWYQKGKTSLDLNDARDDGI